MNDPISPFTQDWAFLSNLYPSPIEWGDRLFPTVENAFQAAKTNDAEAIAAFATLPPDQAAALGRQVALRPDWEQVKLTIMADLLALKFEIPALRRRLLASAPAPLINENWWGDRFWGQTRGVGENHLGRLLMALRDQLRASSVKSDARRDGGH